MRRKTHQYESNGHPEGVDQEPSVSVSVRMVGGLNELVRNEASASDMDVSSWIRKACWDQLRDIEYGAMERRLLASFELLRTDMSRKQQQLWNGIAASFSVLLQLIESDPNISIDEATLEKALQYFNQFRAKSSPARNADERSTDGQSNPGTNPGTNPGECAPNSIISFG